MCVRVLLVLLGALLAGAPGAAWGQTVLTLPDVLSRARERAPQIVGARLALEEARTRLLGASLTVTSNPVLETSAGSRQSESGRTTDIELGISQNLEPRARRSARLAGASAAVALGTAEIDEVTRTTLRTAAVAYCRVLHAAGRLRLLTAAQELAAAIHGAAERRFKAGDIAVLDVNIARAALARIRADIEAAEAARTLAVGELKQVLRVEGDVDVRGDLRHDLPAPETVDLATRLQAASKRPELAMLEAGIAEADAERQAGLSFSKPDYGFGVRYAREEGDHIVLGGLTLTLPVFSKGQELRAAGSARAARLRAELDAARERVRLEVRAAFDAYARRRESVRVLEADALPGLDENDALATRSFEVGQIGLPDLLLLRREILDTRFQYLDALLEAALARLDLDASAAVLR